MSTAEIVSATTPGRPTLRTARSVAAQVTGGGGGVLALYAPGELAGDHVGH